MEYLMVNKKRVIILMIILIGLIISLYLVFTRQIFESKASIVNRTFEISQGTGETRQEVECNDDNICTVTSLDIYLKPKMPEDQPTAPVEARITTPTIESKNRISWESCSFTRSGRSQPFASTTLMKWLDGAARSQGIPPAILASFARHESEYLTTRDDGDGEIQSNNYCNAGQVFCEKDGRALYYQECSDYDSSKNGARTARAMGLMQVIDVYNSDIDTCKISDNIQRGAEIFKDKLGGGSFNDETSLKKAVCRYFGVDNSVCTYNGYDYAREVWNDYQNCSN